MKIAPNDPFEVAILLPNVGFAYILSLVHLHTNTYLKSVYLLSSLGFAHILSSVHLRANFCYWSLCLDIHFLWTGKHCCVPSVRSCSHLFHYSEIQQGCGRAENGKRNFYLCRFFHWFGAGQSVMSWDFLTAFFQSGAISLDHPDERVLGLYLIRFAEVPFITISEFYFIRFWKSDTEIPHASYELLVN